VVADVAILGGGFAGLWTAVALTERDPGIRIAIVEQDIVGGGASGRNGGFFSSSWHDLAGLVGLFGERDGLRYALALADAVHGAAAFVEANAIPCAFHVEGVLGAIAEEWQRADDDDTLAIAERLGVADRLHELDAAGARAIADSPRFVGGAFVADNAICQPARLARGLRRLVLERGVHVFERTRARAIEPGRPVIVRTDLGAVKAGQVVVTTGAWAAGSPWFRRSFGVISDYVVATEPIPDLLEEIGWTTNVGIGDRRDWLYYLRPTDDRRIVIGGGEGGAVFGGRAGDRAATHAHRYARAAARGLGWLFPQLRDVRFTHAWGGPIDQTPTFLPFFRTLEPGSIHAGLGFSGHGLAQTYVGGKILASTVLGTEDEWTSLPINRPESALAPPEPIRYPLVAAAAWALGHGDRREEAGRPRGALARLIGDAPVEYRDRVITRRDRSGPSAEA
jgi:glycine/D-amino acid oxidase-like deaminating enzyme